MFSEDCKLDNTRLLMFPKGCRTAYFIRREKRFLMYASMDGQEIIAHTNNTGSMLGLLRKGSRVLLSPAQNPRRKLNWTVEAMEVCDESHAFWAGVNTFVPNKLLPLLFQNKLLPWAVEYDQLKQEVACGKSRIDGCFSAEGRKPLWVECKNVTLARDHVAEFPDAVTCRGAKHLKELSERCLQGGRAAMLYVVQRPDCTSFSAAYHIDPVYAAELEHAARCGVEVHAVSVGVDEKGFSYLGAIPCRV